MTSLDETTRIDEQIDTAFHFGGLLIRCVGYLFVYAIAGRYDCGTAILTGVLLGDLAGQSLKVVWDWRRGLLNRLGDLFVIVIVFLMVRSSTTWPDDPAMRAILGLAAFGLLVGHVGGTALTRLGPSDA